MSGPRKKSLIAGVYRAGTLGEVQGPKRGGFERTQPCRKTPHHWLFGTHCAVCSVCGKTIPKAELKE